MWSKYKFYFIGVALLAGVAVVYYVRKQRAVKAEEEAISDTEAVAGISRAKESQMNIGKSFAMVAN